MAKLSEKELRERKKWVRQIMRHHLHAKAAAIEFKPAGMTNSVFHVTASGKKYIVRIGESADKLEDFVKEQWVTERAKKAGVPVAKILEIGCEIIPHPYMIQRSIKGITGIEHHEKRKIIQALGQYAAKLHRTPTNSFGKKFDWCVGEDSKISTWRDFLMNEMDVTRRLAILQQHQMLETSQLNNIESVLQGMLAWENIEPHLAHGDLRLKNVIADEKGKIKAILDWEESVSTIAPVWDLSIALHDLSIDQKEAFLTGYGMSPEQFKEISPAMKVINILLYSTAIEKIAAEQKASLLNLYRLRLNGYFNLY